MRWRHRPWAEAEAEAGLCKSDCSDCFSGVKPSLTSEDGEENEQGAGEERQLGLQDWEEEGATHVHCDGGTVLSPTVLLELRFPLVQVCYI